MSDELTGTVTPAQRREILEAMRAAREQDPLSRSQTGTRPHEMPVPTIARKLDESIRKCAKNLKKIDLLLGQHCKDPTPVNKARLGAILEMCGKFTRYAALMETFYADKTKRISEDEDEDDE
jgi:hypothetical protein